MNKTYDHFIQFIAVALKVGVRVLILIQFLYTTNLLSTHWCFELTSSIWISIEIKIIISVNLFPCTREDLEQKLCKSNNMQLHSLRSLPCLI